MSALAPVAAPRPVHFASAEALSAPFVYESQLTTPRFTDFDPGQLPLDGKPAPADYYATAQGKTGAALLNALHTIITNGHRDLGYGGARDAMFGYVDDNNNDNTIIDFYSGRKYTNITGPGDAYSSDLNTEHTWPQSHGATGIAKDDLNMLRPSEIKENGMRGNVAYGTVVTPQWQSDAVSGVQGVSKLGLDANGKQVFEAMDGSKYAAASGQFYAMIRYAAGDRPADFDATNFKSALPTLLQWIQPGPSALDIERNNKVYAVQGNRNPVVDMPDIIGKIDWAALAASVTH